MKKVTIMSFILVASLAGVCLAGNTAVGTAPNPPNSTRPTPNSTYTDNSYTNSSYPDSSAANNP